MSDELRAKAAKAVRLIQDKGFRRMGSGIDDWIWVDYSLEEIEQALEDIAAFFVDRMRSHNRIDIGDMHWGSVVDLSPLLKNEEP